MPYDPASERFRIYRLASLELEPEIVATCATLEDAGVAVTLLATEGEFEGKWLGLLDRPDPDRKGKWIINPYGGKGTRS